MFTNLSRNWRVIWSARKIRPRDFWLIVRLSFVYQKLDNQMAKFRRKTELSCPKGCGRCCENPFVETSLLEMLPAAAHLFDKNEADQWLNLSPDFHQKGPCPFYRPDPRLQGKGRCQIYPLRPLICRLFGFSAKVDKNGGKVLYTCQVMKAILPEPCQRANEHLNQLKAPIVEHYTRRILNLSGAMDAQRYPIALALKKAIEQIGLYRQYRS
jgi:Fe-S-cluster containining protein